MNNKGKRTSNEQLHLSLSRQYFGKGCAEEAVKGELKQVGTNVLLAYGCGSLKRTGLYDKVRGWLEAFIREVGLPSHWSEMGITDETVMRHAADTCFITPGCCKQLSRDEIFGILKERM